MCTDTLIILEYFVLTKINNNSSFKAESQILLFDTCNCNL